MGNSRNLANLLGTGSTITTAKIADDAITADKLAASSFEATSNLLDNGAMLLAQRGTSSTSQGYQTCDRWYVSVQSTDQLAFTQSRSTESPDNFTHSLRFNVSTAETTLDSDELVYIRQVIESQSLQHLGFGTSAAKSLTLSFWVRSSLTGKYSVLFYYNSGARSNTQSFTVNTADTWEYKTITIDGDGTSGTAIPNDNTYGLGVHITLAAGTGYAGTPHTGWGAYSATDDFAFSDNVNFIAQTGDFYITGLQLQVGTEATPFIHEDIQTTLHKCQRYCWKVSGSTPTNQVGSDFAVGGSFYDSSNGYLRAVIHYPTEMRTVPGLTASGTFSHHVMGVSATDVASSGLSLTHATNLMSEILCTGTGYTGSTGLAGYLMPDYSAASAVSTLLFHAEF